MGVSVSITRNGKTEDIDITMKVDALSMRESVHLERLLGSDNTFRLLNGDPRVAVMPSTINALVFVQVVEALGIKPDAVDFGPDDINCDLSAVHVALSDDDSEDSGPDAVVATLPMTLPDGSAVEPVAGDGVDPPEPTAAVG